MPTRKLAIPTDSNDENSLHSDMAMTDDIEAAYYKSRSEQKTRAAEAEVQRVKNEEASRNADQYAKKQLDELFAVLRQYGRIFHNEKIRVSLIEDKDIRYIYLESFRYSNLARPCIIAHSTNEFYICDVDKVRTNKSLGRDVHSAAKELVQAIGGDHDIFSNFITESRSEAFAELAVGRFGYATSLLLRVWSYFSK